MTRTADPRSRFRWPIAVARSIDAPAESVWEAISKPGNLETCHPFCSRNPVQVWSGADSLDEVHYLSGWVFERRFLRWMEGRGYDLEIGRRGGSRSLVSWRISSPKSHDACVLKITVCPQALQRVPVPLRWIPHTLRLRPLLRSYLSSVTAGFEWYVVKGEAVPRNQFGGHPWFSDRPR